MHDRVGEWARGVERQARGGGGGGACAPGTLRSRVGEGYKLRGSSPRRAAPSAAPSAEPALSTLTRARTRFTPALDEEGGPAAARVGGGRIFECCVSAEKESV